MWKPIRGYEGRYEVSDDGQVRGITRAERLKDGKSRTRKGRQLALMTKRTGYQCVNLYKDAHMTTQLVHRLVADAFIPNPEHKPEVNHINGDKHDNRAVNLEWVTGSENIRHAFRTNLKSGNGRDGKLSSEQIRQIRTCSDSQKVIAMRYGISRQMVGLIKQRKAYKEVS